ncbi:fungal specific transcription factor domain-containing protein [Aspergillus undulatus]|uniref:fungal specific transcription factor domain-containing protein n=1 Tax=Aspergillus undulatus TaxID=1810928 RepID=UPI003CCC9762
MVGGTSCNDNAEPHSQPVQRARLEGRGAVHSRTAGKHNTKSQRRKQQSSIHQSSESRWASGQGLEQPSKKRLKTTSDSNGSRRQRNLKNLMMIDRLEANIGRMEARLQDLGFDLSHNGSTQASLPPVGSDNLHSPPSSCASQPEILMGTDACHCESYPGDTYRGSASSHAAAPPDMGQERNPLGTQDAGEGLLPAEFRGILLPRCILDTPDGKDLPALSHVGLEWMSRKSGISPQLSSEQHYNVPPFGSSYADFPRKSFCPLPSREEASSLLYEYLQNFNSLCPLFEKAKLVALLNQDNLEAALDTPACWASANVVFALAIAFRTKDGNVAHSEHQKSWLYIKNAFGTFHDLCLGQPDLWSIQALLGMSIFFLGTMSAEPCCFLTTVAIRMSHQIGLGRREEGVALSTEDMQHRRNIFWIAYCLDREIPLRFGKPPAQNDDDMTIDLPSESPINSIPVLPSLYRHDNFDVFRAHCQLATIKGQLYKNLYSAAAKDRPLSEVMDTVKTLDGMLQSWKEDLPSEYQPQSEPLPSFSPPSISMMLLYLHCSYFNCIIAMHRLIACRKIRTAEDLVKRCERFNFPPSLPYSSRMFMSESLCANAARASIRLMNYMPETHISLVGILIHYPIVALTTLSSTIIQNPRDASRLTDMRLMNQVETLLSSLVVSIPNQVIGQLRMYCATYRAAAEAAVQKTMHFCGR